MGLERELEKRYPRAAALRGGRTLTVRPMKAQDRQALGEFFRRIPIDERQLFKDDVTDPGVIEKWCRNIDYQRILPLLALDGTRIVGDATLHRSSMAAGRHVATVKVSVDPDYRGLGVAKVVIQDLVELAPALGVAYVDAEILPEQRRAIKLFEDLEFMTVGTLPQHVRDLSSKYHDLVLMTHQVFPPEKLAPEASTDIEEVDIGGPG